MLIVITLIAGYVFLFKMRSYTYFPNSLLLLFPVHFYKIHYGYSFYNIGYNKMEWNNFEDKSYTMAATKRSQKIDTILF